ncbi:hypothetical protein MBLNU457_4832t1 [Dothideomycetes sp. NU457]
MQTSSILNYLPPGDGLLPKWLLFISVVSMANSIQSYSTLEATQKVYCGPKQPSVSSKTPPKDISPVTPLSARTFGTWTAITAIVRLYAAYHLHNREFYELAMWTFGVAWAHFLSEWFVFKTTRLGAGLIGPLVVSTTSLVWMWSAWDYYVKT